MIKTDLENAGRLLPGIGTIVLIAAVALFISRYSGIIVNDVILAIVLGALLKNTIGVIQNLKPGLDFGVKKILRVAIILLGLQLNFQQVLQTGAKALLVIIVVVALAIPLTLFVSKRMGLSSTLGTLIGVGSAICGASAVIATGSVINAKERDMALALATIFLFNALALIVYPVLGHTLGFSDGVFGTWVGTAVQDVSSVVATGFAFSDAAGKIAIVVKLTRTVLIVPIVFIIAIIFTLRYSYNIANEKDSKINYARIFPWFVLGFLVMAFVNSLSLIPLSILAVITRLDHFLILMVMASVGASLDLGEIKKVGFNFLVTGFVSMAIMAVLSIMLINTLM